jgi:hypothetical protein
MIDCTNANEAKKALEQAMMLALTVHCRKKSLDAASGDASSFTQKGFSSFSKGKKKKRAEIA